MSERAREGERERDDLMIDRYDTCYDLLVAGLARSRHSSA